MSTLADYIVPFVNPPPSPQTCRVKFNSMGGTPVDDIIVTRGQPVGLLPTTTMEKSSDLAGMHFKGWYTASTGGSLVTETTPVPETYAETTLYAQWEGIIHYVPVYNNQGNR